MIIKLEPAELISMVIERLKYMYNTPNISVTDKSLRKLQRLYVEIQVVPVAARGADTNNLVDANRLGQLADRMRNEEDSGVTINPEFGDSGL